MHAPTLLVLVAATLAACSGDRPANPNPTAGAPSEGTTKTDTPPPPLDPTNLVSIAIASPDHKTLVAALKAADYVKSVANPGPLTVFAPTDAAFAKLPAGTVEGLVQPAKQAELREILKYHVAASVYEQPALKDGMQLGMANGKKVTIKVQDGKITVNGAAILGSVRASNGVVHVVDTVLLPPAN
ncbi:MAG: fasciclin domain-containing protein [Planctomycetota bacterium]